MELKSLIRKDASKKPDEAGVLEAMRLNRQYPIPTGLNLLLISVALGGTIFQLFGMPILFRNVGIEAVWLLLPIALLQPLHWGLVHEAIHSYLLSNRRNNEFCGRLLSITVGIPFDATRFGHMVHHRYSRHSCDRPDVYDGRSPYALAWLMYRIRLFGGVYLALILAPLIVCIPLSVGVRIMEIVIPLNGNGDAEVQRLFVALVSSVSKRSSTRREFSMTLLLYGTSAWMYGGWWPMLFASMYVRGLWHSFADNIAHHGVAFDERERARNYALPRGFSPFVMNHHLHLTHHLYPRVPWTLLSALNLPNSVRPEENYFRAAFRQTDRRYPRPMTVEIRTPGNDRNKSQRISE